MSEFSTTQLADAIHRRAPTRTASARLTPTQPPQVKTGSHGLLDRRPVARHLAQLRAVANRSANGCAVAQLETVISNTTKNYNYGAGSIPVGATTDGYLDPAKPKKGSAPGADEIQPVMTAFRNAGYKSMIKGHLMNGQLGGPGLASNLFPITSRANSSSERSASLRFM